MNIQLRERPDQAASVAIKTAIADCDVHPAQATPTELYPYLAERWHAHLKTIGAGAYHGMMVGPPFPKAQPNASRRDAYPPEGGRQGSSLSFMQKQHLDPNNVALGVLNPLGTGQGLRNKDLATAICAAINDWQIEKWTSRDSRLKGSVVVANEDGPTAAKEIRKRAGDKNFVQVLLLSRNVEPLGQRRYWPIYEAAEEAGLPVGIHAFGYGGNPVTASGWPSYYIEEMVGHSQCQQAVLASLVLEGVFEHFPKLKAIMIEAGFGWAPSLMWRLDRAWQRLKSEVPHLKRPPSDYIREHVWWTTQPMEDPERRDHLFEVIDWIGWDRLLFATDYPHWDFDDPSRVLPAGVSDANRDAFYLGNALKLYGVAKT
jgi:predicted TIM-barrel fold metal-dependent hydrolase